MGLSTVRDRSIVSMGLSRNVSEINGDFSWKSQIFPTHREFCVPALGVPFGLRIGARGQKTTVMGLPGRVRSLTISLTLWIQSTNVSVRRTDRHRVRTTAKTALTHSVARVKKENRKNTATKKEAHKEGHIHGL